MEMTAALSSAGLTPPYLYLLIFGCECASDVRLPEIEMNRRYKVVVSIMLQALITISNQY